MNNLTETLIEISIPVIAVLMGVTLFILLINQDNNKEISPYQYTELQTLSNVVDCKHIIKEALIDNIITYKEYNNIIKYIDSTKTIQAKLLLSKD